MCKNQHAQGKSTCNASLPRCKANRGCPDVQYRAFTSFTRDTIICICTHPHLQLTEYASFERQLRFCWHCPCSTARCKRSAQGRQYQAMWPDSRWPRSVLARPMRKTLTRFQMPRQPRGQATPRWPAGIQIAFCCSAHPAAPTLAGCTAWVPRHPASARLGRWDLAAHRPSCMVHSSSTIRATPSTRL